MSKIRNFHIHYHKNLKPRLRTEENVSYSSSISESGKQCGCPKWRICARWNSTKQCPSSILVRNLVKKIPWLCESRKFLSVHEIPRQNRTLSTKNPLHTLLHINIILPSTLVLRVLAKLRKATISFLTFACLSECLSVCMCFRLYVRPSAWNNSVPLEGFSWNLYFIIFRKTFGRIQVSLKSDTNDEYFTWRPMYTYDNI